MRLATYPILHLALRFLLLKKLHKITEIVQQTQNLTAPLVTQTPIHPSFQPLPHLVREIPLVRINKFTCPYYGSAIALKLAKSLNMPAFQLAKAIGVGLCADIAAPSSVLGNIPENCLLARVWQHFIPRIAPSGWIYLSLTEQGWATWLQVLVDLPRLLHSSDDSSILPRDQPNEQSRNFTDTPLTSSNSTRENYSIRVNTEESFLDSHSNGVGFDLRTYTDLFPNLFQIQHAHARCCGLLQLADRERWIQLEAWCPGWMTIVTPDPFPWLEVLSDLSASSSERHFISQLEIAWNELVSLELFELFGSLDSSNRQPDRQLHIPSDCPMNYRRSFKLAQTINQNFQEFYASCPIFGLPVDKRAQAQVRLGLILITQILLRALLQDYLGVAAPTSL